MHIVHTKHPLLSHHMPNVVFSFGHYRFVWIDTITIFYQKFTNQSEQPDQVLPAGLDCLEAGDYKCLLEKSSNQSQQEL